MYSHGSSARASGGKRGHGGRPYRPPPDRKATNQPPKMKACNCLIELDVEEYMTAGTRQHLCLGGDPREMTRTIRTDFSCHLELPGRRTSGSPVAIVGATYQQTIPAAAYFVDHLNGYNHIVARVRINVKNLQGAPIEGRFRNSDRDKCWLCFEASEWSILAYRFRDPNEPSVVPETNNQNITKEDALRICLDNLRFRLGSRLKNVDIFVDSTHTTVFAALPGEPALELLQEIQEIDTTELDTSDEAGT